MITNDDDDDDDDDDVDVDVASGDRCAPRSTALRDSLTTSLLLTDAFLPLAFFFLRVLHPDQSNLCTAL